MGQMDPHIYAVAEEAFRRLSRYLFLFFPVVLLYYMCLLVPLQIQSKPINYCEW